MPDLSFVSVLYIAIFEAIIVYESTFKFARLIQARVEKNPMTGVIALCLCGLMVGYQIYEFFFIEKSILVIVYLIVDVIIFLLTLLDEGQDANIVNPCVISFYFMSSLTKLSRM